MSKQDELPEIVRVAHALEQDLERLEQLARSVQAARLDTDKHIARAGRTLQDAMQQQEQLAAGLRRLGEAMVRMQARQQAAIETIGARAQAVQQQAHRLMDHMQRFAALGVKAAEATRLLQELPPQAGGTGAEDAGAEGSSQKLIDVDAILGALSDEAKALAASAHEVDLSDVAKEATSLRQRLDSARRRLTEMAERTRGETN